MRSTKFNIKVVAISVAATLSFALAGCSAEQEPQAPRPVQDLIGVPVEEMTIEEMKLLAQLHKLCALDENGEANPANPDIDAINNPECAWYYDNQKPKETETDNRYKYEVVSEGDSTRIVYEAEYWYSISTSELKDLVRMIGKDAQTEGADQVTYKAAKEFYTRDNILDSRVGTPPELAPEDYDIMFEGPTDWFIEVSKEG